MCVEYEGLLEDVEREIFQVSAPAWTYFCINVFRIFLEGSDGYGSHTSRYVYKVTSNIKNVLMLGCSIYRTDACNHKSMGLSHPRCYK